jgi:predicted phage terminase large subunit-like protein
VSADWIDSLQEEIFSQLGTKQTWSNPLELALSLDSGYVVRDHLKYLSDRLAAALHDVEQGKSRYLAVSLPPRTGKSMLTSVYLPLWVLHKHPSWEIMLLSHDPSLAAGWGRQIRNAIDVNGPSLDLQVAKDAGAAKEWEVQRPALKGVKDGQTIDRRGVVLSRSIRESVTGRGAKVMVLDDITKDFADAHSPTIRNFVWDWWTANSRTRLHPPSLVIAIQTRWHEDDFVGRLLSPEYDGDPAQWEVISFPALAEGDDVLGRKEGEPLLSPIVIETAQEALARWADIRQAVGSYAWSALFQQSPSPASGNIFSNDWWQFWRTQNDLPEFDRVLTSWDMAFKNLSSSDYVVGQLWASAGPDRFLLRQIRKRLTFTESIAEMRSFVNSCNLWLPEGVGVHEHLIEDKANGTAVIDTLTTEIPGLIAINPTESKEARARSISPTVESKHVFLPAEADWLPDFLSEARNFPNSAHDDQIDCTAQALRRMWSTGTTTPFVPQGHVSRSYAAPPTAGTPQRSRGRYGPSRHPTIPRFTRRG